MTIEKDGKIYEVKENAAEWTLTTNIGNVAVDYKISKQDCPTWVDLAVFVKQSPEI